MASTVTGLAVSCRREEVQATERRQVSLQRTSPHTKVGFDIIKLGVSTELKYGGKEKSATCLFGLLAHVLAQ